MINRFIDIMRSGKNDIDRTLLHRQLIADFPDASIEEMHAAQMEAYRQINEKVVPNVIEKVEEKVVEVAPTEPIKSSGGRIEQFMPTETSTHTASGTKKSDKPGRMRIEF